MKTHKITITVTEDVYTKLTKRAEKNFRTLSQEVNYILHQAFTRPGEFFSPTPLIYPEGVREFKYPPAPLNIPRPGNPPTPPTPPYKITCEQQPGDEPSPKDMTTFNFTNKNK